MITIGIRKPTGCGFPRHWDIVIYTKVIMNEHYIKFRGYVDETAEGYYSASSLDIYVKLFKSIKL